MVEHGGTCFNKGGKDPFAAPGIGVDFRSAELLAFKMSTSIDWRSKQLLGLVLYQGSILRHLPPCREQVTGHQPLEPLRASIAHLTQVEAFHRRRRKKLALLQDLLQAISHSGSVQESGLTSGNPHA